MRGRVTPSKRITPAIKKIFAFMSPLFAKESPTSVSIAKVVRTPSIQSIQFLNKTENSKAIIQK